MLGIGISGCGSKLNQATTGFGPCCHLPEFHFGVTLFMTHSHLVIREGGLTHISVS